MIPWITLAIAAIVGAIIGGPVGFVLGLLGGLAFNLTVGILYNRSRLKAQQGAAAEMVQRTGAPRPPYPLDPQDRLCAKRIAEMLPGAVVKEARGIFGPTLEILVPSISHEPLAVFSRSWDPDKQRICTLLLCSGNVHAPIIQVAADSGLQPVGDAGPFTMFTRS